MTLGQRSRSQTFSSKYLPVHNFAVIDQIVMTWLWYNSAWLFVITKSCDFQFITLLLLSRLWWPDCDATRHGCLSYQNRVPWPRIRSLSQRSRSHVTFSWKCPQILKFSVSDQTAMKLGMVVWFNIFYSSQDVIKDRAERKAKLAPSMIHANTSAHTSTHNLNHSDNTEHIHTHARTHAHTYSLTHMH